MARARSTSASTRKPKVTISDAELGPVVVDAIQGAETLLGPAAISKRLKAPYKRTGPALEPLLNQLAAEGRIVRLDPTSAKKKPAYATRPLDELLRSSILAAVASGPLAATKISTAPAFKPLKDFTRPDTLTQAIEALRASGRLFAHPGIDKAGRLKLAQKDRRYGLEPADPRPFLAADVLDLKRRLADRAIQLRPFGITPEAAEQAAAALLAEAFGIPLAPSKEAPETTDSRSDFEAHSQLILAALDRVHPAAASGAMVGLARLRQACSSDIPDKAAFDRAVLVLAEARRVALSRYDDPASLGPSERLALVPDGEGGFFNAIARRL